jgi:hypothetical protein
MIEVHLIPSSSGECCTPVLVEAEKFVAHGDGSLEFSNVTRPETFFGDEVTEVVAAFAPGEWRYFVVVDEEDAE